LYFIKLSQSYTNATIIPPVAKKSALFLDKNNIGVGSLAAAAVSEVKMQLQGSVWEDNEEYNPYR
jgi:hypothetical protein